MRDCFQPIGVAMAPQDSRSCQIRSSSDESDVGALSRANLEFLSP